MGHSNRDKLKPNMIDMTSTFPYFLVRNEKLAEEVPSIIVPSEDGSYYKDEWLGHKTPKRFVHMAMMESLGGDRFIWPDEPIMRWIDFSDFVKRLAKPEICCTDSGVPLFFEFLI